MKDLAGTAVSILCICHCLATPAMMLFAGGFGLLKELEQLEWLHALFLALALTLAALSLPAGFRIHRDFRPLLAGAVGVALMGGALAAGEAWETAITVPGAALVIGAHLANRRLRELTA